MSQTSPPLYHPVFYRLQAEEDCKRLQELFEQHSDIQVRDEIEGQLAELIKSRHPYRKYTEDELKVAVHRHAGATPMEQYGVWVYYPWLRTLTHLLDEQEFVLLRTNRNRYKITDEEQQALAGKKVGIIGLSVGQSIAVTMAMERGFGEIRLGDFDTLELTNLNRIRSGVHNLGAAKVIVTAREIAEIDPFLKVICYTEGVNEENIDRFMLDGGKLDIMVDECDSIDMKILARQRAKAHRIPVVMDTSDRGLLDIERFDLDPARPILHGLIGNLDYQMLKGLTTEDKVPYILRIIGIDAISKRMKASLVEVEKSISTWPQLASAVVLGGALGADVCRRISLGQHQHSGRYYVDLEQAVPDQAMEVPEHEPNFLLTAKGHHPLERPMSLSIDEMTRRIRMCDRVDAGAIRLSKEQVRHLVEQAVMAPSGGNVQPWQWVHEPGRLHLFLDPSKPDTFLDAHRIAAYMSLGSAAENLTLAAYMLGLQVRSRPFPVEDDPAFACSFEFFHDKSRANDKFAYLAEFIPRRITNRKATGRKSISIESLDRIKQSAESIQGAKMHLLDKAEQLDEIGQIIASAERMRILHPEAHANMVSELRWTDEEVTATRDGVDLATLELTTTDWAGIRITSDPSVVALIRDWRGGANLEKVPRKMLASASNAALITMPSNRPIDYFNGGRAVQRAWLEATKQNVAFQPLSVVTYMFSRLFHYGEERFMQPSMVAELKRLRSRFVTLFPIAPGMGEIFLFRLGVEEAPRIRSLRRYADDVLSFVDI
ncbi:Rv1355c family protein [Cohnella panacarvi]|uniref:Rv1355c family protein n=1 Tax=Cohnella panacarvi TaxID=400776 RepID=UPI00146FB189|nr:Rv1355c family protein [Cohnella panacarvi]